MTAPSDGDFPQFPTDVPTAARMYDYQLGGKDNFEVDRAAVMYGLSRFPDILDAVHHNRQFLYRAVKFLAQEAGIRQFLDLGSGLPTQDNVHQVAQRFQPDARVVYVDNDPIVQAHGRALLARDDSTTFIAADMTEPETILGHLHTQKLLDFSQPTAALFLSVSHSIVDDDKVHGMLAGFVGVLAPGSYVAFTQLVADTQETVDESNRVAEEMRLVWKTRLAADVVGFLRGLEPVEPGLVDITNWRPDPDQPPLAPISEALHPYIGASAEHNRFVEFGGVLRKP